MNETDAPCTTPAGQAPRVFVIAIHGADYYDLAHGLKSFVLMKDQTPSIRYGDVLHLTHRAWPQPLIRWASYISSGVGLAPDWIIVEVKP